MTRAIFPGAFDPPTFGQIDIARRAARLWDEVIVAVEARPGRGELLPLATRVALLREALTGLPNVRVEEAAALAVAGAEAAGARVVVRGLRVVGDFEHEFQQALAGRYLAPDVDTACLMAAPEYTFLSSGIVREVARLGGDLAPFVPEAVKDAILGHLQAIRESKAAP